MLSPQQHLWGRLSAITSYYNADLPTPEELLPAASLLSVRFRLNEGQIGVERSLDSSASWQPITITNKMGTIFLAALVSPNFTTDQTVYVLSQIDLYRSTDGGDTWKRWIDKRLVGRDYKNAMTAGAISPLLKDGSIVSSSARRRASSGR
jgi:hypothetical protein